MFQAWRLKLKEAEVALQAKRLEEARKLLLQSDLREFLPARQLLTRLAKDYADRGRAHAAKGESRAGWNDLETAVELGVDPGQATTLREALVAMAFKEAEAYLQAEDPQAALERLKSLEVRQAMTGDLRRLKQVAAKMDSALQLAREGRFRQAVTILEAAQQLRPDLARIEAMARRYGEHDRAIKSCHEKLHVALADCNWQQVAVLAEQILTFAPADAIARDSQKKAWAAVGAKLNATRYPEVNGNGNPSPANALPANHAGNAAANPPAAVASAARFLLWVDGVGGYLVCEGDEIHIGQPVHESPVDLPILGDLSRDHAIIRRSGDGYLIVPRRATRVDGRTVTEPAPLTDGCILELGEGVRLRFRRPHPLSASAVLEFVSRHRTQPPADGIILFADSCVMGPGEGSHIVCRHWSHDVVLFRHGDQLMCRAPGKLAVDGRSAESPAAIRRSSKITLGNFSLSLEET